MFFSDSASPTPFDLDADVHPTAERQPIFHSCPRAADASASTATSPLRTTQPETMLHLLASLASESALETAKRVVAGPTAWVRDAPNWIVGRFMPDGVFTNG